MRALVTGSNGFLGSHLVRRLCGRGDAVRCLVRENADLRLLEGLPIELVPGDVTLPGSLERAVEGVDAVFHLAGLRRSPRREDFERVNAGGTRRICEALVRRGAPARLVLASSLAAVGPSREHPTEDAPLRPVDWYGESKAEAERIARSFEGGALSVVIARPSRITGPGDRENLLPFRLVAKGLRLSIGGGPRPFSVVDVEDAVTAFVAMADRPEAGGEAFFVSRETTTLEEFEDAIARALGVRPRTLYLPERLFRGLAAGADLASKATGRKLPLNRKLAQQLLAPGWTCSTRKAQVKLGFVPAVPMEESLARSARWYREHRWL